MVIEVRSIKTISIPLSNVTWPSPPTGRERQIGLFAAERLKYCSEREKINNLKDNVSNNISYATLQHVAFCNFIDASCGASAVLVNSASIRSTS